MVFVDDFYLANINCDMIISFYFLKKRCLGVMPHRHRLLWERPQGWNWLGGDRSLVDIPIANVTMAPKTSKWRTDDYAVRNDLVQHVIDHFGGTIPSIDAFASEKNKRFPRFWDKHADAFAQDWASEGLLWINPPFDALHRVVEKIRKDGALAIVVAPEWKNMSWWKKLKGMAVAEFLFDVKEPLFEREG